MSFTRLNYDSCAYVYDMNQSMKVGDYRLNAPLNKDNVFYPDPSIALSGYGGSVCEDNVIDVDSELMGLNVKATNCPSKKFKPSDKPFCKLINPKTGTAIVSEDTRMSNPPCTLRGTGWNRWEWLCSNPQDMALTPFETNINNRIVVKDNHRPCIPNPMDHSLLIPNDDGDTNGGKEVDQNWKRYEQANFPNVHWRCCGEIEKL